jgi:hypothetical protein
MVSMCLCQRQKTGSRIATAGTVHDAEALAAGDAAEHAVALVVDTGVLRVGEPGEGGVGRLDRVPEAVAVDGHGRPDRAPQLLRGDSGIQRSLHLHERVDVGLRQLLVGFAVGERRQVRAVAVGDARGEVRAERLHPGPGVGQPLGVVPGEHLVVHVEEELALPVVEAEHRPVPVRWERVEERVPGVGGRGGRLEERQDRVGHLLRACRVEERLPVLARAERLEHGRQPRPVGRARPRPHTAVEPRDPRPRVHLVPVVVVLVGEQVLAPVVERGFRARGARPHPVVVAGRAEQLGPGAQCPRLAEQPSGAVVRHEQCHGLLDERRRVIGRARFGQVEGLLQTVLDGRRRGGEDGEPRREPDGGHAVGRVEPGEPARFVRPHARRRGTTGEQVLAARSQLVDGRHPGSPLALRVPRNTQKCVAEGPLTDHDAVPLPLPGDALRSDPAGGGEGTEPDERDEHRGRRPERHAPATVAQQIPTRTPAPRPNRAAANNSVVTTCAIAQACRGDDTTAAQGHRGQEADDEQRDDRRALPGRGPPRRRSTRLTPATIGASRTTRVSLTTTATATAAAPAGDAAATTWATSWTLSPAHAPSRTSLRPRPRPISGTRAIAALP